MAARALEIGHSARACLFQQPIRLPIQLRRAFASSSIRRTHGPLVTFPPTSSPELDALLAKWRTIVFMPAHLLEAQRRLIFRPTRQHLITGEEPVVLQVRVSGGGADATEPFTLRPLNHVHDEPSTGASFTRLLALLNTRVDWTVLPGFLSELRISGRHVTPAMAMMLLRAAGSAGRFEAALQCLRAVERTGIRLDNVQVVVFAVWALLQGPIGAGWSDAALGKAAKQADDLVFQMRDPNHAARKGTPPASNPTKRPELLGAPLALAALWALRHPAQTELVDEVERTARRALALWEHADFKIDEKRWDSANAALLLWSPLALGLRKAAEVVGAASALGNEMLALLRDVVEPLLVAAEAQVLEQRIKGQGKLPPLGMELYHELQKQ